MITKRNKRSGMRVRTLVASTLLAAGTLTVMLSGTADAVPGPVTHFVISGAPVSAVAGPHHLTADALRYELHRVWVVDGVLASGQHHLVAHRRLYLDEDSWFAVCADGWDGEGRLWKFSHGTMPLVNIWCAHTMKPNNAIMIDENAIIL